MKFETPILNVSLFDAEDIVTTSAVTPTAYDNAKAELTNIKKIAEENILTFTF